MRKTAIFDYERKRSVLRHGTRAVLCLESELPLGTCTLALHAREMAGVLLAHAERVYLSEATRELEDLVGAGRGFAFRPHHFLFTAHVAHVPRGVCMTLSLRYAVGEQVRLFQQKMTYWTVDGAYRYRREARGKSVAQNNAL